MTSLYDVYRRYLEEYLFDGGREAVLAAAYEELRPYINRADCHSSDLLEIHTQALADILAVRQDRDAVHWG